MPSFSSSSTERWTPVTHRNRCPICHHDSWCVISPDGLVVKCMHVFDGAFRTGIQSDNHPYGLHSLSNVPAPSAYSPRSRKRPEHATPDPLACRAVYGLVLRHCADLPSRGRRELARRFGPYADDVATTFDIGYCDTTGSLARFLDQEGRRQQAIESGVLTAQGLVCRSLRGKLLIPYRRDGLVYDLRGAGLKEEEGGSTKARSLKGGYAERGVEGTFFNHDVLGSLSDGVIHLAGGEWKTMALALAGLAAVGTRGEGELTAEQLAELTAAGVAEVVLHIDAEEPNTDRPRTMSGVALSAGRHLGLGKAQRLADAGFRVRIAEPPRQPGTPKVDPDALLRDAGPEAVRDYARSAPPLATFRADIGLPATPPFRPVARQAVTVAAVPEPVLPTVTLPLVEEAIREKMHAMLHGERRPGATLIITAPPGVGKSRQALEEIRALSPDQPVAFFGPRHELYGPEHQAAGLRHIYGRNRGNCIHADLAAELGRKGYGVDETLCCRCPLRRGCAYYAQFAGGGHRYAALPTLHTHTPEGVRAVVLDEVTPQDLVETRSLLRGDLAQVAGDPRSAAALKNLAELLIRALDREADAGAGAQHGGILHGPVLLTALTTLAGDERSLRRLIAEAATTAPAELSDLTVEATQALPPVLVSSLVAALDDEFTYRDAAVGGGILTLDPHNQSYRIARRREVPEWLADATLIILNATADPDVLLDLLGRNRADAEVYDPHLALPPEVEVVQLTDTFYGKTTLTGKGALPVADATNGTLTRAIDRVRSVLDPALTTGLITFKGIEAEVGEKLGLANDHTAHFGAIAGSNAFAGLEQLVVLGTFSPPPSAAIELASVIYAGREPLVEGQELRRVPYRGWRATDGQGLAIDVVTFEDGRIDRLYREMRDGALLQAAHRLRPHRPNGRSRVRLILATALPLEALPPTAVERSVGPKSRAACDELVESLVIALADLVATEGCAMQRDLVNATGRGKATVSKYWSEVVARAGLVVATCLVKKGATTRHVEYAVLPVSKPERSGVGAVYGTTDTQPLQLTSGATESVEIMYDPRPDLYLDSVQWERLLCAAHCRYGRAEDGVFMALHEARRVGATLYWRGAELRFRPVDKAATPGFRVVAKARLQPHQHTVVVLLHDVFADDIAA